VAVEIEMELPEVGDLGVALGEGQEEFQGVDLEGAPEVDLEGVLEVDPVQEEGEEEAEDDRSVFRFSNFKCKNLFSFFAFDDRGIRFILCLYKIKRWPRIAYRWLNVATT